MVDFDDGWNMIDFDDGLMGFSQPSMLHNPTPLPPGLPTPEEIDALIAQEMTRMSLKEREKALHDVHGIGEVNDEDPAFIRSCLFELEEHLVTIKHDTSYALAEVLSRKYVHDKKLRMMFLRADEYETKQAAERMIRFFELKNKLFGVNKLVKDITLDDLGVDDMETLQSGCVQVSTSRDAAGRPIVVLLPKLRRFKQAENAVRIFSAV